MLDIRENLDAPLWGAEAIGREAGLTHEDGTVNFRAVYYALENGHLPASKIGKRWVSTLRRLRSVFAGDVSEHTAA
jgi:hypothetical protein